MYLSMIILASVMFSFQFVFNNGFRKEEGSDLCASLKFTFYSSAIGIIILFIINKFHIEFSLFSTVVACVYSIVCIALSYVSIKAFAYANLSVYSVFSMIGGMLLPFLYGLMCGEEFKVIRLVCCALITLSVAMSVNGGRESAKAVKYYIMVFILNGLVGVISKFHQSHTELCVDSGSFMIYARMFSVLFCAFLLLTIKGFDFSVTKKAFIYSSVYSALNGVGNLLLLVALLHLPATVQYPVVTGGVIVISTLITLLRREPIQKKEMFAAFIAFVATVFMAL